MNSKLATAIIAVDHGKLRLVKGIDTTTQAIAAYQVQFTFGADTEWANMTKTAVFQRGTDSYAQILDSDNCAVIPWEILNVANTHSDIFIDIGLLGIANGVRLPTNKIRMKVLPSVQINNQTPAAPTPTVYEQLTNLINSLPHYTQQQINTAISAYIDNNNIATETYVNTHANNNTVHITQVERQNWSAKYVKPQNGIPKSDLAVAVQTSLENADTALQSVPIASSNQLGGIKIGNGLTISNGVLSLDIEYINDIIIRDAGSVSEGM